MWKKKWEKKKTDKIVKYSSDLGFNDIKFQYAHGEENIYFLLHQKHILLEDYENSTQKNKYQHLHKKMMKLKVILLQMKTKGLLNMVMV